jgi:hypothetical protein
MPTWGEKQLQLILVTMLSYSQNRENDGEEKRQKF